MSESTFDRRSCIRATRPTIISVSHAGQRESVLASVVDISQTGVRFECVGKEWRPGEIVQVTITEGEYTTSVVGEVLRVKDLDAFTHEIALAFVEYDCSTPSISDRSGEKETGEPPPAED